MSQPSSDDSCKTHGVHSTNARSISLAAYCQDALYLKTKPDCSPQCYEIVTKFLLKHQHYAPKVWLSLPAATDMVCQDVYSHYPLPVQRIEPGQLPDALQTVLSVLLHQAQIVCQSKNAAQAKQTFQQQDSLSTSNSILRSMLLVLHVIALANYKICGQTHTVAASATLVLVFSRFMDYLGDEHVALKQTATLPDVDTALLVEVVKKVMPNLRQTVKRIPGSAVIFIDVLLKLSSLVPSVQGVAQAIIAHGGLTLLVVGLTSQDRVAERSANYLCWLCMHDKIPLVVRLHSTALLDRMLGFKHLGNALAPPALIKKGINPKHVPADLANQLSWQMDMVELMSHLLRCQKDYSGLNAEAAVQRACEIAAEEDNACKGADAAPYHINSSGELVMDLRLSDVLTSMQNMLGLQPSQQESEQQKRPHQSRSATAAKSGLPPGQKCPEFAFPSAPKPSAATWTEAERVAIKSWQLYNWLRAEGEHMGASEKEADDLESSIVQLLAHLLVDYLPLRDINMDWMLMNIRPVFRWGHLDSNKPVSALCCAMLDRLKLNFAKQITAQPTCSVNRACTVSFLAYDCDYIWQLLGQLWQKDREAQLLDHTCLDTVLSALYAATSSPMHCYAFLTNDPNVESVLLNAKEPDMPRSTHSKLPHYAAVLAQICQVELQLGRNNFYPLLCKTGLFERSLIGATATFVMTFAESYVWADSGVLLIMARLLWRLSQLLECLPGTQLPAPVETLKGMARHLVDHVIQMVACFLEAKQGVPGINLQFIACGLLFITAVRKKLNLMGQALKKPSIPQSCDSGFDERHLLCCLYDELGSWRLSNHSSFCTEKAGLEDSACTKAYRTSFAGLSSAIAKADAAWDQAATNFTSTASVATVTTPLSEYTLPLSLASCTKYLNSTKAAVLSADEDDQSICQLAGLPRLHASSFEVICITGLCTAAQTDIDWESIKEHTYIQAVRFLAGYDTAWLLQIAHDRHHAQCEILQLEAHVHLIGKVTPHQLNIPVANLAASEAGNAIVLLLLLLVKVLTSYECPSQLNVPIADPKRHSRSRKSRSAPGQAADSSATDDGQTGERMLTDGTCADAVRMTLARFKQLLDVVLETLFIIKGHPVWGGIVWSLYQHTRSDPETQQLRNELLAVESAGLLEDSQLVAIKHLYTDWLGLLPVPCKQPGPTTEQLQAKAEAKKAKKQRQKVNKQRQKASRPHPQQAQQAQHDTEAGAVEQAQHGEVAEQAQHGVVAVQARHVEQAQHVQHTEQAHHSEKTQDSFEAPQIQHTLTGQHDDVTLCCQDVHAWNSQSQTTSATQSSLPDDAARCETEDLCSGAEQDAIQQPQEPSPTDKLLSAAHPCHQETCVHTAALHQLDAYASQQGQMQTASQQPGHPASEQESDDAFLQQLVTCPITQEALIDPVIAADGHTYERMAIEAWLEEHDTSPMNGSQLSHRRLVPNLLVKRMIDMQ